MNQVECMRVVSESPAPTAISDILPLKDLALPAEGGRRPVSCVAKLTQVPALESERIRNICADLMAERHTIGYCIRPSPRAVFFDMDATVIREESLVALAAFAGVEKEVHEITERAMAGSLDFAAALRERVSLLRGLDVSAFGELAGRLTLMPGIKSLVAGCHAAKIPCFMVSGGFVELASHVAAEVGFDGYHANRFDIRDGRLTGGLSGDIVDARGKRDFVAATCRRLGIGLEDAAAVGDGANDLQMLNLVGTAVGHQPKEVLLPHLHFANWLGDHRLLLPLFGVIGI